ncbi:MAG TPA: FHA domain-containing protein [Kofleriaceae bacterium]|nr:FHA domain-containing protein [Kofleriaceae bacterium]
MSIYLEIVRADGRIQRQHLEGERTTIGGSKEASVWVADAPELEPLHLLVVPREQGVWMSSARNARTPTLLDGKPFESGQLALGSEIDVGSITFRVVAASAGNANRTRTIIIVITALAIAVPLLARGRSSSIPRMNAPAPQLFAGDPDDCPLEGEAALKRGRRAAERARSKTLRYPFDPREGLSAVELYRAASACLEGSDEAAAVAVEAARVRQRIEDDYQLHRLHLERAVGESDWKAALEATHQLLAMLADRPGDYRDWLVRLQRYLELQISAQEEREKKEKYK